MIHISFIQRSIWAKIIITNWIKGLTSIKASNYIPKVFITRKFKNIVVWRCWRCIPFQDRGCVTGQVMPWLIPNWVAIKWIYLLRSTHCGIRSPWIGDFNMRFIIQSSNFRGIKTDSISSCGMGFSGNSSDDW